MHDLTTIVRIDRNAAGSLSAQLVISLRRAIELGVLQPGDRLPSTRELAEQLGVSRGTVVTVYEQLTAEGYFVSGQGLGTTVNERLREIHRGLTRRSDPPGQTAQTFAPQSPPKPIADLSARPAWRAAWRRAAASPRLGRIMPVQGDTELLTQIADHLRLMRGTVRSPQDILVTAGMREGLGLMLTALGTTMGRGLVIGVDVQGPASLREVAERHGATVVTLPTDASGLVIDSLPEALLDAVIITPNKLMPGEMMMPLDRRLALLSWASRTGVVVIEDDFDSEQQPTRAPLPTLAALDDPVHGVVATLGSFSATLSQTLAAGYLVAPRPLAELLLRARNDLGCPVSPMLQIALADLLASGELRKHVARLRRARLRA